MRKALFVGMVGVCMIGFVYLCAHGEEPTELRWAEITYDTETGWLHAQWASGAGEELVNWNVTSSLDGRVLVGCGTEYSVGFSGSMEQMVASEPVGTVYTLTATFCDLDQNPLETLVRTVTK